MKYIIYIFIFFVLSLELKAQTVSGSLTGKVSFISPQNVYVKFKTTEGILPGDTLFIISDKLIPVLVVKNLSSYSCACALITTQKIAMSQDVVTGKKVKPITPGNKSKENIEKELQQTVISADTAKKYPSSVIKKQKINGSLAAYSYSDFSNTGARNTTQLRYNYTLYARNIGNSKFSVENYITFRHKLGDWSLVKSDLFNALKVYSFAIMYEPDKTSRISLGRTINYRISSIGAIDGLQVEKTFNKISVGAIAGTRPDNIDYGFNSKLLQYGGYIAFDTKKDDFFSQSSLAFMEQMNNMKTDRRFLYFQHSNSIIKDLYLFSTLEVDLYKVRSNLPQSTFDLTSLYISLRYRITKNFTLTASYDQRKNVLFYETYKSLIDSVFQSEKRQSLRLQANYRITQNMTFGIESGYRFSKTDPRPSKNLYAYFTYVQVPGLGVSITLNGTYLESAFMTGKVFGADIAKDLFKGRLQTSLGYRYENYTLPESQLSVLQHIGELSLYWQLSRKISFSVNYEGTFERHDKYNRVYMQIRKRF